MDKKYVEQVKEASENAYVPYSHFPVGAILISKSGKVYEGCNIENASFGLTNCAERTAIFKAVSEKELDFLEIYIYGETDQPISPCGACRQVLVEFCEDKMPVYLISKNLEVKETSVGALLPYHFKSEDLNTNI
ncbi:MAG: cytidine deaminase [Lactovum sp.]